MARSKTPRIHRQPAGFTTNSVFYHSVHAPWVHQKHVPVEKPLGEKALGSTRCTGINRSSTSSFLPKPEPQNQDFRSASHEPSDLQPECRITLIAESPTPRNIDCQTEVHFLYPSDVLVTIASETMGQVANEQPLAIGPSIPDKKKLLTPGNLMPHEAKMACDQLAFPSMHGSIDAPPGVSPISLWDISFPFPHRTDDRSDPTRRRFCHAS